MKLDTTEIPPILLLIEAVLLMIPPTQWVEILEVPREEIEPVD